MLRRNCTRKLHSNTKKIKIFCVLLLCFLIPIMTMFYTRGCRHTKLLFDADRADSFRHGHPHHLPDHLFQSTKFDLSDAASAIDLLSARIPPFVHYIWCDRDYFQFQNYLSVLSTYKVLKPTAIYFHYKQIPELDVDGYYQFFMDLRQNLPNLILKPLLSSKGCSETLPTKVDFIFDLLNRYGGVYIGENTIIINSLTNFRQKPFAFGYDGNNLHVVMMEKNYLATAQMRLDAEAILSTAESSNIKCTDSTSFNITSRAPCVSVSKQIFPVDVFELKSDFGQVARWAAFGKKEELRPIPSNTTIIPNIVHYVWLGQRPMSFFAYLSLLSSLYVLNAEMVYIHGNFEPQGKYWEMIRNHKRVVFVWRDFPEAVFSEPIVKFASHASDYLRAFLLLRYGGIYMDWDVLWVRPIPDHLRRYDTVACPDFPATGAFPDVFNMGVLLAAKGSYYLRFFLESYHHYLDYHWSYNAIHIPYKVYEKHADLLYVDRHLQVCFPALSCIECGREGHRKCLLAYVCVSIFMPNKSIPVSVNLNMCILWV